MVLDVPLEFVREVPRAGAVAKARHVEGCSVARHDCFGGLRNAERKKRCLENSLAGCLSRSETVAEAQGAFSKKMMVQRGAIEVGWIAFNQRKKRRAAVERRRIQGSEQKEAGWHKVRIGTLLERKEAALAVWEAKTRFPAGFDWLRSGAVGRGVSAKTLRSRVIQKAGLTLTRACIGTPISVPMFTLNVDNRHDRCLRE